MLAGVSTTCAWLSLKPQTLAEGHEAVTGETATVRTPAAGRAEEAPKDKPPATRSVMLIQVGAMGVFSVGQMRPRMVAPEGTLEAAIGGTGALAQNIVVAAFFFGAAHPRLRLVRRQAFLARITGLGVVAEGGDGEGENRSGCHDPAC